MAIDVLGAFIMYRAVLYRFDRHVGLAGVSTRFHHPSKEMQRNRTPFCQPIGP
jgi:hypothetical protein